MLNLALFHQCIVPYGGASCVKNIISRTRSFITFIDDHTRISWVYLLKEKSKVTKIFYSFHSMLKNQFQTSIQVLRTNNGCEYFNTTLDQYLSQHGIIHQSSCLDASQQSGVLERKKYHLLEIARTLMFTMHVPKFLLQEVALTASYLINQMPSKILKFITLFLSFKPHTPIFIHPLHFH